jgi:cap2 methyltransferase
MHTYDVPREDLECGDYNEFASISVADYLPGTYPVGNYIPDDYLHNPTGQTNPEQLANINYSTLGHLRELQEKHYTYDINELIVANPGEFKRDIRVSDERKVYHRRNEIKRTIVHWGQRKLLLGELEFLTKFDHLAKERAAELHCTPTILYIGAACGIHLNWIIKAFPHYRYILFDPNKFSVMHRDNIEIHREYFTNVHVSKYGDKSKYPVLFYWSDIRCNELQLVGELPGGKVGSTVDDKKIFADMEMQQGWYRGLKPLRSMLKFRLDWTESNTTYLAGSVRLQVFPGRHSTETRLIVGEDVNEIEYNNKVYEEQMFHHNVVLRRRWYDFGDSAEIYSWYCHCYDCASEYHLIREYLRVIKGQDVIRDRDVINISRLISNIISPGGITRSIFQYAKGEE